MIDNINPFKHLISLSNELSAIRLQEDYLLQCEKNNALINELSKELKALVIVQNELKNDRERFIKKDNISINKIDEITYNTINSFIPNNFILDFKSKESNYLIYDDSEEIINDFKFISEYETLEP